jgi:hypothetical protein
MWDNGIWNIKLDMAEFIDAGLLSKDFATDLSPISYLWLHEEFPMFSRLRKRKLGCSL